MAIKMTLLTSRNKETTPHHQQVSVSAEVHNPLGENRDLEESENIEEFSSRAETPKETLKRKMSSPLVLIRKVSSNVMQTVSVTFNDSSKWKIYCIVGIPFGLLVGLAFFGS